MNLIEMTKGVGIIVILGVILIIFAIIFQIVVDFFSERKGK